MQIQPMQLEIIERDASSQVIILRFTGDLDTSSIAKISSTFEHIVSEGKKCVIADFSGVSSISSAALGELMGGRKRLIENDGDLILSELNFEVRSKLNLMGANKIFKFHNDVRSAINAFKWEFANQMETVGISFPAHLIFVPPIRQLVSRIARQKGYGNRDSFRIETIVDEICNNAIEHGKKGIDQKIELKIHIGNEKIELDVINVSDPEKLESLKALLTPTSGEMIETQSDSKRGRGLALIKMLSNNISVDISDKGTSVHVTKMREE